MRRVATGALTLAALAGCPLGAAGAQWLEAPAGVSLRAPADTSAPSTRPLRRDEYVRKGAGAGALVGAIAGAATGECGGASGCRAGAALLGASFGAAAGALGGLFVYNDRHEPRPAADTSSAGPPLVRPAVPARYRSRGEYAGYGAIVGVAAGLVAARFSGCEESGCHIPAEFLTVPVGALLGAGVGAIVWDYPYQLSSPRPRSAELPPQPGLARYMTIGAAAGGAGGVVLSNRRCDECSRSSALVQNVPLGAAVGAIGGAIAYGVAHWRRAEGEPR
jgi:hypothetical protein